MLNVSHNLGDLPNQIRDGVEKESAKEVARECRAEGLATADDVQINLDSEMRGLGVRPDRIRQLANQILSR